MDGIHDLGGMQGFGKVPHTINSLSYQPVFDEPWEHLGYILLLIGAMHLKKYSVDEHRHAIERMEPRHYIASSYFDRINIATASLLVEKGVLTKDELERFAGGEFLLARPSGEGRASLPPRQPFEAGDRVFVRDEFIPGHVRAPAYVRGKTGVVLHRTTQKWPFPDSVGHAREAALEPTYHVCFDSTELWGQTVEEATVVVDLFEGYLEKAQPV
jgi:nitrile hydratase subunit beta